jgi:hypothetical protein
MFEKIRETVYSTAKKNAPKKATSISSARTSHTVLCMYLGRGSGKIEEN